MTQDNYLSLLQRFGGDSDFQIWVFAEKLYRPHLVMLLTWFMRFILPFLFFFVFLFL